MKKLALLRHLILDILLLVCCITSANAQMQVREEPFHKQVLENEYIRILDVNMQPGDTSQFHIHSTPSLFIQLTDNVIRTQDMGQEWIDDHTIPGKSWFRSFSPEIQTHRVTNLDSVPFHVIDIEILSAFDVDNSKPNVRLPFSLLFQNEKAYVYKLTRTDINNKSLIATGPVVIVLVKGAPVSFHDLKNPSSKQIKTGQHLYIEPGTTFSLSTSGSAETLLVLFEIK